MSEHSRVVTHHTISSPEQLQLFSLSHTARLAVLCERKYIYEGRETAFFVWDLLGNKKLMTGTMPPEAWVCFSLDDRFLALATTSSLVVFDSQRDWRQVAKIRVHFSVDEEEAIMEGLVFDDDGGFVLLLARVYSFRRSRWELKGVVVSTSTWTERALPCNADWEFGAVLSTKCIVSSSNISRGRVFFIASCDGRCLAKQVTLLGLGFSIYLSFSLSLDRSLLLAYNHQTITTYNFDAHTFTAISQRTTTSGIIHAALSHNNRFLATAECDRYSLDFPFTCSVYDLHTHTLLWRHREQQSRVSKRRFVCFSLHDRFVIVHLDNGEFVVRDILTGDQVYWDEETNHKRLIGNQNEHVWFSTDSLNNDKVHVYQVQDD